MPHKISQHTYPPHPSPASFHHQTPMPDQAEWQGHMYPSSHPNPALCTESSGSPTPTPSASSALTSLSPTPSPPLPPRRNPCHIPSLTGGLRSSPWHGSSMLMTEATAPIEKHQLL